MSTRIYLHSMFKLSGCLGRRTVFTHCKPWNPRVLVMEDSKMKLDTKKIGRGFALVIVNEDFEYHEKRFGAEKDKNNILKFCESAKFTAVNDVKALKLKNTSDLKFDSQGQLQTHNLTAKEMEDLFKTISRGDFSSFDAFVCFISSHGDKEGILGTDGNTIPLQEIVDNVKATPENRSLAGIPKLFFAQNCRGKRHCVGVRKRDGDDGDDVADTGCVPITIPREADVLLAYSSVDEYKSYRNKKEGSWFISELTKVFNKHAHNMDLSDMLTIVNKVVANRVSENGEKQMPCFLSTLRMAVYFDVAKPGESLASSSQEPPNNQPAL